MTSAERSRRYRVKRRRERQDKAWTDFLETIPTWDQFLETLPVVDPDELLGRPPHRQKRDRKT